MKQFEILYKGNKIAKVVRKLFVQFVANHLQNGNMHKHFVVLIVKTNIGTKKVTVIHQGIIQIII